MKNIIIGGCIFIGIILSSNYISEWFLEEENVNNANDIYKESDTITLHKREFHKILKEFKESLIKIQTELEYIKKTKYNY